VLLDGRDGPIRCCLGCACGLLQRRQLSRSRARLRFRPGQDRLRRHHRLGAALAWLKVSELVILTVWKLPVVHVGTMPVRAAVKRSSPGESLRPFPFRQPFRPQTPLAQTAAVSSQPQEGARQTVATPPALDSGWALPQAPRVGTEERATEPARPMRPPRQGRVASASSGATALLSMTNASRRQLEGFDHGRLAGGPGRSGRGYCREGVGCRKRGRRCEIPLPGQAPHGR